MAAEATVDGADWQLRVGPRAVMVRCSTRADGDFHLGQLADDRRRRDFLERRRALVDLPWTMIDEVHGTEVVAVTTPGEHDGATGDAIVTECDDAVLGCWAGDCAPVVLVGATRSIAVVHAGWRGLAAGVIDAAAQRLGEPVAQAVLGPHIDACCYEFGAADIDRVAQGVHASAADLTVRAHGRLALDVEAAVAHAIDALGAPLDVIAGCTGCRYDGFSHRIRRDTERHVVAAWQHREVAA